MREGNALVILGVCAGWSEACLLADAISTKSFMMIIEVLEEQIYGSPGGTFLLITYHLLLTTYYLSLITYYLSLTTYYLSYHI